MGDITMEEDKDSSSLSVPILSELEPGYIQTGVTRNPGSEDFDDILEELGGMGRYQKKILYLLLGPLFFILPFPLLHQVLVLHAPKHECLLPPAVPTPSDLGINQTVWQSMFLPSELLPDMSGVGPSSCNYYNFTSSQLHTLTIEGTNVTALQMEVETSPCSMWLYDKSEFEDTLTAENDWVCDKAHYVPNLYTLAVVGLIIGTFVFSAIADFFGRKTSFYIGIVTVIVFTFCHTTQL